ncbi:transcriptional regulator, SARP family protein [Saccharothrix sp. CB00851]|nr:BTAD domain-containing putative transcriptional regulator [Saccharothrix sp. CB00851]OKI16291.1 transcriptional regulator, SARP family protein [Saccharothrix sp. CB00851]
MPVPVGHARQKSVLVVLVTEADRVVPPDRLIERIWGEHAPARARSVLRTYLSNLRLALAPTGITITWRDTGYQVTVEPDRVDVHRFRGLLTRARDSDDPRSALALVEQALALWRGEPLAELDTPWAQSVREHLHRERNAAEADRIDWALDCGRHGELLPELTTRTAEDPLDERLAGQLMLALYRTGRPADALELYRRTRQRLADELGTDPGPALQQLHQRILTADHALTLPEIDPTPEQDTSRVPPPRQLPVAPAPFVGRHNELERLDAAQGDASTVVISALAGAGGIGKTWLALHWAHRHADRFPDGQLFVDLRGFSPEGEPLKPAVAVRGFLDALGADPGRIPVDLDAQAALYRSLVAGKRMLVVLDNAATADQVAPLLPGTPTCTVLITGRTTLALLIDRHGAHHLQLGILSREEAHALLAGRIGGERVAAEPDAAGELVDLCGRYPLALSIMARYASTRPHVPLAEFTAELRELGLDMFDNDDPAVSLPVVLSWSLRGLTDEQRTTFALLGIAPGPDIDLPAAASLTGLPIAQTRKILRALEEHSLLERRPHDRYSMHDLIRAYATTTAHNDLPQSVRRAALDRVVDFYLHTAYTADHHLYPHRGTIPIGPPAVSAYLHPLPDHPTALAWMDTHHAHLLAAQHTAAAHRRHQAVWHFAWLLGAFHQTRGHRDDDLAVWQAALNAAAHLLDPSARIRAHRFLGRTYIGLGQHDEAIGHLHQALVLAEHHHHSLELALTHHVLARAWGQRGDDRQALRHARHALNECRGLDQPAWEADALNTVGWYSARLGDYDTARDHCQAALTLHRRHRHTHGEAYSLDSLGFIDHHTGRHHQAIDHYNHSLSLRRTFGYTYEVAESLDALGHPHAALGRHDLARGIWQEALELYRQQGRDADAERVQRQLDDLDKTADAGQANA